MRKDMAFSHSGCNMNRFKMLRLMTTVVALAEPTSNRIRHRKKPAHIITDDRLNKLINIENNRQVSKKTLKKYGGKK